MAWFLPSSRSRHTELPLDLPHGLALLFKPSTLHNNVPSAVWIQNCLSGGVLITLSQHDVTIYPSHTAALHPNAVLCGGRDMFFYLVICFFTQILLLESTLCP